MVKSCIETLLNQTVPCDVLVVDNASSDDTRMILSNISEERVYHMHLQRNTGGAGGFNFGMKHAVEKGYEYIWLMDDDTMPRKNALEELLKADSILAGQYGFLSSLALWTDGSICRINRQKFTNALHESIELLQHNILPIQQATFVSCFMKADVVRRVGLPIQEFFIWGDDIEYTRRIAVRKGMPSYIVGSSVVVHATSSNYGSNIALDEPDRMERYKYAFRNENYLYRQEGLRSFAYYTAKCGANIVRVLLRAQDHRLRRCGVIIHQYFAGLRFNPDVEFVTPTEDRSPFPYSGQRLHRKRSRFQ